MKMKTLIAGVLLITSGMIFLDASTRYLTINNETIETLKEKNEAFNQTYQNISNSQIRQDFMIFGILGLTISITSLIGGILSIFRKKWKITLALGIISIITIVFVFLIMLPLILSIIALIIVYFSRNDFKDEKQKI